MKAWIALSLVVACVGGGLALERSGRSAVTTAEAGPASAARPDIAGEAVTPAEWFDDIFRGLRNRGGRTEERRFRLFEDEEDAPERPEGGGYYRTVCVRLCDGFPIPMSFSTTPEGFGKDARRCERACPGGRLFVSQGSRETMEGMADLEGRPYAKLPAAFLHQTTYVANCTCRGNPWDEQAMARHQAYADAARRNAPDSAPRRGKASSGADGRPAGANRWDQTEAGTGPRSR